MIKTLFQKIRAFVLRRKIVSAVILIAVLIAGYFGFKNLTGQEQETRYVLAAVEKGVISVSISGSGQVSASSQLDLKAKTSGDIIYLNAKVGQEVKSGALLAQLDSQDAQQAVRDAQDGLETARLSLEELKAPADELSLLQSENSLAQAKESKKQAEENLEQDYESAFNSTANAFLELPTVMTGLQDIILGNTFKIEQDNIDYYTDSIGMYNNEAVKYRDETYNKYNLARTDYDESFKNYKATSRFSSKEEIESIVNETYETTKNVAEAIKSVNNLVQLYKDELTEHGAKTQTAADTHLSSLNTYTGKTNTLLTGLLSANQNIKDGKQSIVSAERSIQEKTISLNNLKAGADAFEIRSAELAVKQKENVLKSAKENLADYSIRAPFDGVIAACDVKKADSVSSGSTIATVITSQRVAEISLNEVDAAQIKAGQKAVLAFDAVENLSISGEVAEIDAIGAVSQGVVTYNAKIVFDTQDERIKPGMSVSAAVITEIKQDVLVVSSSAIKSAGEISYVEILENASDEDLNNKNGIFSAILPAKQIVEIGLSDDSNTEIVSGLNEGDKIISKTINSTAKTSTAQSASKTQNSGAIDMPSMGGGMMIR